MARSFRVSASRPVVIDSSVAFKWFDTSESGSDEAAALLQEHSRDETTLIAPAHLALEVINALTCRGTAPEDSMQAVGLLGDLDLLVAPVDEALLMNAVGIAAAEELALYDAVFVALAARLDAELVTADRRQASTRSCRVRFIG